MTNRSITDYCKENPVPKEKRGPATAIKRNPMSAGWAWSPDEDTTKAIAKGSRKAAKARRNSETEKGNTDMTTASKKTAARKPAKKTAAKKAPAKKASTAKKVVATNKKTLKQILPTGYSDRKARRILRKSSLAHELKGRWEFTAKQAKDALELLK